jgi:small subunit ribosomal protein S9
MTILARAVGRRKEAVAHVQLLAGSGQFTINRKAAEDYLPNNNYILMAVQEMLRTSASSMDTFVQVHGGGYTGQAEAIKLAVARALCQMDQSDDQTLRKTFKTQGYLTQDARVKERRKYGLKKARKAPQYHKRSCPFSFLFSFFHFASFTRTWLTRSRDTTT